MAVTPITGPTGRYRLVNGEIRRSRTVDENKFWLGVDGLFVNRFRRDQSQTAHGAASSRLVAGRGFDSRRLHHCTFAASSYQIRGCRVL